MHGSEEQSEGRKMEVDSIVALESWPTQLEVTFGIGVFFGATNGFNKVKGAAPILTITPTKVIVFFFRWSS
jgi:hypothetical protein